MSRIELFTASEAGYSSPGLEPWLVVCLLAFVPGALIVILPSAVLAPVLALILGVMGALILTGVIMLCRTEWNLRRGSAAAGGDGRLASDSGELR